MRAGPERESEVRESGARERVGETEWDEQVRVGLEREGERRGEKELRERMLEWREWGEREVESRGVRVGRE